MYDGWHLIKESVLRPGQADVVKYYVWGLDLSGTLGGAGGIGGLVAAVDGGNVYYYAYDANGNVGQVVDGAGGVVARYEYDAFGGLVHSAGALVNENVFRFSTKYFDEETDLYYYGYRYYSTDLGRWLNRDPLEELGSRLLRNEINIEQADLHLYRFVLNNPFNAIDPLGLIDFERRPDYPGTIEGCKQYCDDKGQVMAEFTPDPKTGQALCICKEKCDDDKCDENISEIKGVMKGLHRRYLHQCRDKKGQWETHRIAFDNEKRRLRKLVKMAENNGCSVPPKAYIWLNTECPLPSTSFSTTPGY